MTEGEKEIMCVCVREIWSEKIEIKFAQAKLK